MLQWRLEPRCAIDMPPLLGHVGTSTLMQIVANAMRMLDVWVTVSNLSIVMDQVVHFWAPWCEPCKQMDEVMSALASEAPSSSHFLRVSCHTDECKASPATGQVICPLCIVAPFTNPQHCAHNASSWCRWKQRRSRTLQSGMTCLLCRTSSS
jgi:Thioredoxin